MLIASATFAIKCHDLQTGQLLHNYTPDLRKDDYIKHITWNKDGTWLASTPKVGSTFIVTIKKAHITQLHKISNIQEPMCSVFKHDTKKYLSVGTANGSVLTYDLKVGNVCQKYPKVDSSVFALYYCSNDSHLIAGCTNGEIIVFNASSKVKSSRFRIPNSKTLSCTRPHQRKRSLLAGGSQNGLVAIWDLNASKLKYCNKFHNAPVREISFIPNRDDIVFTIGMDKKIRFQDIKTNVSITEINSEDVLTCMDVSHDSTNMIVGTQTGNILVYDIRNIKQPKLTIEKAHDSWIEKIAVQTCLTSDSEASFDESKLAHNDSQGLSVIAEEISKDNLQTQKSTGDSFIDEFGLHQSLNSPINATNKRRSSQNFRLKSTSECSEADSFLDALGLNSPNQGPNKTARSSLGPITKKVESLLQEKPAILDHVSPILKANKTRQSLLLEKVQEMSDKMFETPPKDLVANSVHEFNSDNKFDTELKSSTPKIIVSGVGDDGATPKSEKFVATEDIRKIVKELVAEGTEMVKTELREVMAQEMRLLKDELQDIIKETALQQMDDQKVNLWRLTEFLKRMEADRHMLRVKESIKMEDAFVDLVTLITGEALEEQIIIKSSDNEKN